MNNALQISWLIPILPLIGFLINGLGRKQLSKSASGFLGSAVVLASFCLSLWVFFQVLSGNTGTVQYFDFIHVGKLNIPFGFKIDQLSALFLLIITGIGFLIHVYSISYMHEESSADFAKYFSFMNLFVFSMLILVMAENYVVMYIGWEGVGICSYFLIGYWFKNKDYTDAGKKAFIMNRIGDLGFLLAAFWFIAKTGSVSFDKVLTTEAVKLLSNFDITAITLLLLVGATGKSAQIPLFTWLPDAMAGPTPVSALIHAATMVTAGVYMIARTNLLYSLSPISQSVVAVVGLVTAVLAATIALKQNDIKKVLAYSTVSQLGYMFLALGVGAYTGAIFHVMTHAFFKALLFLGAGSVIHAMSGQQDMRYMGGLKKNMPITHITFLLACFAIAGIPPFSGFFSKDEILAAAFSRSPILWVVGVLTAVMTAFYMFRLYAMTFRGNFRGTTEQEHHLHESPSAMTIPLIILAIFSVVGGFVGIPEVFTANGHQLNNFLEPVFRESNKILAVHPLSHTTEYSLMAVSVAGALIGLWVAWKKFAAYQISTAPETGLGKILANKWYVDELYDAVITRPMHAFGDFLGNVVDKKGIDGIVNGTGKFVNYGSRQVRWLQSGQVGAYILLMVLGILGLFIIQLFL